MPFFLLFHFKKPKAEKIPNIEQTGKFTSELKFEEDNPLPTVNQPERMLWSSPKSSSLLRPRAKCSIIRYISSGFAVDPANIFGSEVYNTSQNQQKMQIKRGRISAVRWNYTPISQQECKNNTFQVLGLHGKHSVWWIARNYLPKGIHFFFS